MPLFPSITAKKVARLYHGSQQGGVTLGNSSTVMTGWGICAGSTLTTDNARSSGVDADGRFYTSTSSAISGTNIGSLTADRVCRMDEPSLSTFNISLSTTANIRIFIGLLASTSLGGYCDGDTLTANGVGLQFSSDRGDTTWQAVSFGGSQTTTNTAAVPSTTLPQKITLEIVSSSSVLATIFDNTGSVLDQKNITANLPSSTSTLYLGFAAEPRSAAAISVTTRSWGITGLSYFDQLL